MSHTAEYLDKLLALPLNERDEELKKLWEELGDILVSQYCTISEFGRCRLCNQLDNNVYGCPVCGNLDAHMCADCHFDNRECKKCKAFS